VYSYASQLQKLKIATPDSLEECFKLKKQYRLLLSVELAKVEILQMLLITSVCFLTSLTPYSTSVPIGGHSRFPQSRLAQLLQKFSRTCLI